MGRPSLAAQRREQILDAVTRCVGEFGLEGTTLERVAEASGFSRGHIRHYLGNREEMLVQFQNRLTSSYTRRMREIAEASEPGQRGAALVAFLFGKEWGPGPDSSAINALMWAAARNEPVRAHLRESYLTMERTLARALRADFPAAPSAQCAATAYTLLCLAFAHSSLQELSFPAARQRSITATTSALLDGLRVSVT
ncbi:MAG TPA: TetR/AcrR family transcriptional regulator [Streptosporangiaceae bacterium]